ncbi:uncharacterized protein TNCV_2755091 [Trichonephila clavipes]|nr:uncharacterized protein TNCV_2755091 [Trichonephila clavipes]
MVSWFFNLVMAALRLPQSVVGSGGNGNGVTDTFPYKENCFGNNSKSFLFENKDCRVIIDCTEFPIHKPNRPLQQQRKINHCKDCNTLNGVIGIMPSGALCFVCRLHCGRISDRGLFLRSKPMDLLEPNHVAMAGKGLLIEEE